MISAVVLTFDAVQSDDVAREREIVTRSLVWLVSAVVAGVVRDVTLAVPARLGLGALADQAGCALVEGEAERERLAHAVAACREPRVLILRAGFQPEAGFVDEIEAFTRSVPADARAVLRRAPATLLQRLFPQSAPIVGVIAPRAIPIAGPFETLARRAGRGARLFDTRARPIR